MHSEEIKYVLGLWKLWGPMPKIYCETNHPRVGAMRTRRDPRHCEVIRDFVTILEGLIRQRSKGGWEVTGRGSG